MKLRVVFLLPALDLSGAERMVLRVASRLDRGRFDPLVVGFVRGTGLLEPHLERAGVPYKILTRRWVPRAALPLAFLKWSFAARPDVLLTFMFHANMVGRLARLVSAVPALVCSERIVGLESPGRIRLNRLTVRLADAVTTNSRAGQRFWADELGLAPASIQVVYNGVDTEEFSPGLTADEGLRIGVLAQFQKRNGHAWLIDALARLDREVPAPWTCLFAGIGPEESNIRAQAARNGLQSRVQIVGHCSDAPQFLRSLHLSIHPAFGSGMPNAVLESMACGVPVVATSVGGTPEVIEDAISGYLVEPGDIDTTVRYVRRLLADDQVRRAMGVAARERVVKNFTIEKTVRETERIITEVAASR